MCFNGAKNWQLGWYAHKSMEISSPFDGKIYGIADYSSDEASNVLILIRGAQKDWYVSFNRNIGINSGAKEYGNQVLVHSRPKGFGYGESTLEAKLSAGQLFQGAPLDIAVTSIDTSSDPGFALLKITGNAPTCFDIPGWKDDYGSQCDWYTTADDPGCPTWGHTFGTDNLIAEEACCHCGGGTFTAPTPVVTPAPVGTPAPVVSTPAPVVVTPAPVVTTPAPVHPPSPAPAADTCISITSQDECNEEQGCGYRVWKKECNTALSNEACSKYNLKWKCKRNGCLWHDTLNLCDGRWDPAYESCITITTQSECNAEPGCGYRVWKEECNAALSSEACGQYGLKWKCKRNGCVWNDNLNFCDGRWD